MSEIPEELSGRERERFEVLAIKALDHNEEIPKGKILKQIERERTEDSAAHLRSRQRNYERKIAGCT